MAISSEPTRPDLPPKSNHSVGLRDAQIVAATQALAAADRFLAGFWTARLTVPSPTFNSSATEAHERP